MCVYCDKEDEMDGNDEVDITPFIEDLQMAGEADETLAIELTNQYL